MLSIVIPAYNEGKRIHDNLLVISNEIGKFCNDFELIPVNDGSSDNTEEEMFKASSEDNRIHPVTYQKNRGKGGAIKEGVAHAQHELIGFIDADLDLSPNHFEDFLKTMRDTNCDIVIGSKMHKESKLEYPLARKIFSYCYYIMLKILFGLKIKDTQTGVKLYKSEIIKDIAPKLVTKGFAFDIEILALAANQKAKIEERPITLDFTRETSFGRIKFKDIWKMFTDTIKIWWNLKVRHTY